MRQIVLSGVIVLALCLPALAADPIESTVEFEYSLVRQNMPVAGGSCPFALHVLAYVVNQPTASFVHGADTNLDRMSITVTSAKTQFAVGSYSVVTDSFRNMGLGRFFINSLDLPVCWPKPTNPTDVLSLNSEYVFSSTAVFGSVFGGAFNFDNEQILQLPSTSQLRGNRLIYSNGVWMSEVQDPSILQK